MVKTARIIYLVLAWIFLAAVTVQVFLAGLAVVARLTGWDYHIGFGHMVGVPVLFMLIAMYLGRMPRGLKWMTWGLFGVFILQAEVIIFLRTAAPLISAFHPVLALVDVGLGLSLARQARALGYEYTPSPKAAAGRRAQVE
jgi:hypothetical protein